MRVVGGDVIMLFTQSLTYQNLLTAFQEKCRQSICHQQFALRAQQEGLRQVRQSFRLVAKHESNQAGVLMDYLLAETDTLAHLENAIKDKNEEMELYQKFIHEAIEEGYEQIAKQFELLTSIDKSHSEQFAKLLNCMENDEIYEKPYKTSWICSCCGYTVYHREAPRICPLCHSEVESFELENHLY